VVECILYPLGTKRNNPHIPHSAASLLQKHSFSLVRFDKDNRAIRSNHCHWKPGKTRAGTNVGDTKRTKRQVSRQKERFIIMPVDGLAPVADGGQVEDAVPPQQPLVVPVQEPYLFFRQLHQAGDADTQRFTPRG